MVAANRSDLRRPLAFGAACAVLAFGLGYWAGGGRGELARAEVRVDPQPMSRPSRPLNAEPTFEEEMERLHGPVTTVGMCRSQGSQSGAGCGCCGGGLRRGSGSGSTSGSGSGSGSGSVSGNGAAGQQCGRGCSGRVAQ